MAAALGTNDRHPNKWGEIKSPRLVSLKKKKISVETIAGVFIFFYSLEPEIIGGYHPHL